MFGLLTVQTHPDNEAHVILSTGLLGYFSSCPQSLRSSTSGRTSAPMVPGDCSRNFAVVDNLEDLEEVVIELGPKHRRILRHSELCVQPGSLLETDACLKKTHLTNQIQNKTIDSPNKHKQQQPINQPTNQPTNKQTINWSGGYHFAASEAASCLREHFGLETWALSMANSGLLVVGFPGLLACLGSLLGFLLATFGHPLVSRGPDKFENAAHEKKSRSKVTVCEGSVDSCWSSLAPRVGSKFSC